MWGSSFARLAGVGIAVGGASYIPFASTVGTQTAGASGFGNLVHVRTDDPLYYIEYKDAVCTPILPHGHVTYYNCLYTENV
jgi:hypothetical protein